MKIFHGGRGGLDRRSGEGEAAGPPPRHAEESTYMVANGRSCAAGLYRDSARGGFSPGAFHDDSAEERQACRRRSSMDSFSTTAQLGTSPEGRRRGGEPSQLDGLIPSRSGPEKQEARGRPTGVDAGERPA